MEGKTLKRPKKETRKIRKKLYKTPANYYESKRHKRAVQLNQELNKVEIPSLEAAI
jgi:hypothetical protein